MPSPPPSSTTYWSRFRIYILKTGKLGTIFIGLRRFSAIWEFSSRFWRKKWIVGNVPILHDTINSIFVNWLTLPGTPAQQSPDRWLNLLRIGGSAAPEYSLISEPNICSRCLLGYAFILRAHRHIRAYCIHSLISLRHKNFLGYWHIVK